MLSKLILSNLYFFPFAFFKKNNIMLNNQKGKHIVLLTYNIFYFKSVFVVSYHSTLTLHTFLIRYLDRLFMLQESILYEELY